MIMIIMMMMMMVVVVMVVAAAVVEMIHEAQFFALCAYQTVAIKPIVTFPSPKVANLLNYWCSYFKKSRKIHGWVISFMNNVYERYVSRVDKSFYCLLRSRSLILTAYIPKKLTEIPYTSCKNLSICHFPLVAIC
jgi:hypothetical protein